MKTRAGLLVLLLIAAATGQVVDRGPYLQKATPTSVVICWRTDVPTDSVVAFGPAPGALGTSVTDSALVLDHAVTIAGLTPGSVVYYSVGTSIGPLAGDDADHFVRVPPAAGTPAPTRMWVLGDSGLPGAPAQRVRDAYEAYAGGRPTDLILMLGDNAYPAGTQAEYQVAVFQNMYEDFLRSTVVWPTIGNHDAFTSDSATQTGAYFDIFELPVSGEAGGVPSGTEAYYSFDHGNIHFVCLDSAESLRTPTGPMLTWLQADLAANTQDWLIAFWHHPPYTKGSHDSDAELPLFEMRFYVLPILEAFGVDLVLTGHSHSYERSMLIDGHYDFSPMFDPLVHAPDPGDGRVGGDGAYRKDSAGPALHEGAVYAVAGSSSRITPAPLNHPVMIRSLLAFGSMVIDVHGDQLDAVFLDDVGTILDEFTLVKGGVSPVQLRHVAVRVVSEWKFDDTGTDLGTTWTAPGFADDLWSRGPGTLGYGEGYIATPVSFGTDAMNKQPTTYFRHEFDLTLDPAAVARMRMFINYDDGFVCYLNGQEVARSPSMGAGTVLYGTLATPHEAGQYEGFDFAGFAAALQSGSNVLAVEVHQHSPTSSDLVFDAAILVETDFASPLGACATGNVTAAGDVLTIGGSAGGLARSVDVTIGEPFTIGVSQPPAYPLPAELALYVHPGLPGAADVFTIPSVGTMCFPPRISLSPPVSSVPSPGLATPAPPLPTGAPRTPYFLTGSIDVPLTFTIQGIVADSFTTHAVTNALLVNVIP